MNLENWCREFKIVKKIEDLLDWQNNFEPDNASDIFLKSERFYKTSDGRDAVIYALWYRVKGDENKQYHPTLSKISTKKKIPFWNKTRINKMVRGGAGHIYCIYNKKIDRVEVYGGHDFGYGLGDNACIIQVRCDEKYFFDEYKKVLEYWSRAPIPLGSEEWMKWAKEIVVLVEENPHLSATKWWNQIEDSENI